MNDQITLGLTAFKKIFFNHHLKLLRFSTGYWFLSVKLLEKESLVSHAVNTPSYIKNVPVCCFIIRVALFFCSSFPSVSCWECGFLRKTAVHSLCCLSQDSKSPEHQSQQSLRKATDNPSTLWGKLLQRPVGSYLHVLSFLSVRSTLRGEGREADQEEAPGSLELGGGGEGLHAEANPQ